MLTHACDMPVRPSHFRFVAHQLSDEVSDDESGADGEEAQVRYTFRAFSLESHAAQWC